MTPDTMRSSLLGSPNTELPPPNAELRSCEETICGYAGAPGPDCESGSCR
jgi:hypothetical protein